MTSKLYHSFAITTLAGLFMFILIPHFQAKAEGGIPNIVGTWNGKNETYSEEKGFLVRDKTVIITEQNGRRFKGHLKSKKKIFGVIYPDNKSFTWVSLKSKGYNQGRILADGKISACYVETGGAATAGCAIMAKQ